MTDFMDMFVEMLPMASNLQNKNNEVRKVLDYTIGEYMENISDIGDELFLTSATGGWLDAWGRDYGVIRRVDEDDDSFRERIIFEKLEYLTAHNLQEIYGVQLFSAFDGFDATENDLTSDNPYLTDWYMGVAPTETQNILNKKFILGGSIIWYNNEELDYLIEYNTNNPILRNYIELYDLEYLEGYNWNSVSLKKVKLTLTKAEYLNAFLYEQHYLTDASLNCPNAINGLNLFANCQSLTSVNLDLPKIRVMTTMFDNCVNLESISLNFPKVEIARYSFRACQSLENVDLNLPSLTLANDMFVGCVGLNDIDLDLPSVRYADNMFKSCGYLKNVKLNMPKLSSFIDIFKSCVRLETIDVTIPTTLVNSFKSYVLGLELSNLTSFKINGEEVDLS